MSCLPPFANSKGLGTLGYLKIYFAEKWATRPNRMPHPIYLLKRGGGNNSATTRPTINIQIKLLLSSELCTAMLFNGGNNSVAKVRVQQTVPSRPANVPNLMVTATTTTKNTIGNMDFTELCRKEKVRPKASTTQSPVPSSALAFSLRHILNQAPYSE